MPTLPLQGCVEPGCALRVTAGRARCTSHQQAYDSARKVQAYSTDYSDSAWRRVRLQAFRLGGWRCVDCGWRPDLVVQCEAHGVALVEQAVLEELRRRYHRGLRHLHGDHIKPVAERPDLRLSLANVAVRCSICHSRKTIGEVINR